VGNCGRGFRLHPGKDDCLVLDFGGNVLRHGPVDAVRVAGVGEFPAICWLARKYGIPVVPHVGDMGQIHQHLVLFNHIGMGHEALLLEQIPHLQSKFAHPCRVEDGRYAIPQAAGLSSDFL